MLVITSGRTTRQYGEGGFPSKMNCNKAVTSSADTMTKPCKHTIKHVFNRKTLMWFLNALAANIQKAKAQPSFMVKCGY